MPAKKKMAKRAKLRFHDTKLKALEDALAEKLPAVLELKAQIRRRRKILCIARRRWLDAAFRGHERRYRQDKNRPRIFDRTPFPNDPYPPLGPRIRLSDL